MWQNYLIFRNYDAKVHNIMIRKEEWSKKKQKKVEKVCVLQKKFVTLQPVRECICVN